MAKNKRKKGGGVNHNDGFRKFLRQDVTIKDDSEFSLDGVSVIMSLEAAFFLSSETDGDIKKAIKLLAFHSQELDDDQEGLFLDNFYVEAYYPIAVSDRGVRLEAILKKRAV